MGKTIYHKESDALTQDTLPLINSIQEIRVFRLFQSDDCTFHSEPARKVYFSIYLLEIFSGFSLKS